MHPLEHKIPPPLVALSCAAAVYGLSVWLPQLTLDWPGRSLCAAVIALCGLACDAAGIWAFRRHRTTVNPLSPHKASAIVQDGIYRFTRNPMYVGMALLLTAWAVWQGQPLGLLALALFVAYITRFQIQPEERALQAKFGADYTDYMARVRRWL
ncbi:MAG: isoprenylcysteine carboxylmethyltransferase family protein [Comamonas sp.]